MEGSTANLTLWGFSSSTLTPFSLDNTFQRTATVTARNMMIGALGILFNAIAIIFLSCKRGMKLTLKITMLGMALNDFIFTANTLVLSNPNWTWISYEPYCWPVMYLMASPILISYFITTLLAVHNFVAVVYPLHCDKIMTRSRSVVWVCVCFASGYLVILGCLGVNFPPGVLCSVLTVMPRVGLAVECGACLVNCCVIVGMNIVIILKIKESRSIAKFGADIQRTNIIEKPTSKASRKSDKTIVNILSPSTRENDENVGATNIINNQHMTSRKHGLSAIESDLTITSHSQVNPANDSKLSKDVYMGGFTQSIHLANLVTTELPRFNLTMSSSMAKTEPKLNTSEESLPQRNQIKKPIRRVKTSKTLMILTFWSCLMSLPFMVFMVYVSFLAPDRQTFTTSDLGVFMVWICTIHSIGNPLLYIWRFMDWKSLIQRIIARIRH